MYVCIDRSAPQWTISRHCCRGGRTNKGSQISSTSSIKYIDGRWWPVGRLCGWILKVGCRRTGPETRPGVRIMNRAGGEPRGRLQLVTQVLCIEATNCGRIKSMKPFEAD